MMNGAIFCLPLHRTFEESVLYIRLQCVARYAANTFYGVVISARYCPGLLPVILVNALRKVEMELKPLSKSPKRAVKREEKAPQRKFKKNDWQQLMKTPIREFKGEMPDFTEEGWARRKPKKK